MIIDSDDYGASDIETLFFPGGEPHVKIPAFGSDDCVLLHLKLRTWADVGFAACVQSALSEQGVHFTSFIPYFPGARQDKSDGTAPATINLMANLLDYADFKFVFDPHSSVLLREIDHESLMPADLGLSMRPDVVGIIAPDEGAHFRARIFRDVYCPEAQLIQCSKVRDPHTGNLSNYSMPPLTDPGQYIIVDDICDGGGTFNLLVEAFYRDPMSQFSSTKLELFVSHGIFSRGLDAIDARIEHITTTDSWCRPGICENDNQRKRLTIVPLLPALMPLLEGIQ